VLKTKDITLVEMLNLVSVGLVEKFHYSTNSNFYWIDSKGGVLDSCREKRHLSAYDFLRDRPTSGPAPLWSAVC
jgi:hypothetical protein